MKPVVLVTVGTDHHRFDRLMTWIESWLADGATDRVHCIAQHGVATPPRGAQSAPILSHPELCRAFETAAVVVCHGGPATIAEARRRGHVPICVPRDPGLGEHVDDHQQRFARRIAHAGVVVLAETEPELRAALDRALAAPAEFRCAVPPGPATLPDPVLRVGHLIGSLLRDRVPRR